jgi:hypothetical protein
MNNISDKVLEIVSQSLSGQLELVTGENNLSPLLFNQRENIRRINFYLASKYLDRDDDALFWNLSNHRISHFAKNIDLDTKDFMPYGIGEYNFLQSWALRKKFTEWCRANSFYLTLNDISEGLSTYGSIVWKRCKENGKSYLQEVKLDNLYFDQAIDAIRKSNIVEKHWLNPNELWSKDGVWDNVRQVLKAETGNNKIEIWEYWGWYIKEGKDTPEYNHTIGYGYGEKFIKLWEETVKNDDCPYYDFHLGRYRGRWQRVGVVERLFPYQERINQLVNQNAQATDIASLLLLRTQDSELDGGNVLTGALNGQIINSSDLQQIGIDNRGLSSFIQEMQLIENQADKVCLTPDIVQGEQSPSGTPFRTVAVVNANSKGAFTIYKQSLGESIAKILIEDIIPSQAKSWSKEEFIEMAEDDKDVDIFDQALLDKELITEQEKGVLLTVELRDKKKLEIADSIKKKGRRVIVDDSLFNFKWGIKMTPTNESVDKAAQNDAMFNALQIQGSNPANADTPLFRQYLENNGISYWKLSPKQKENLQVEAQGQSMPQAKQPDALMATASQV